MSQVQRDTLVESMSRITPLWLPVASLLPSGTIGPTPPRERWRDEYQRALVRANPDGSEDHLVALILGSYFHAMAGAVSGIADPQAQDRLCQAEAGRFLVMLRGVPPTAGGGSPTNAPSDCARTARSGSPRRRTKAARPDAPLTRGELLCRGGEARGSQVCRSTNQDHRVLTGRWVMVGSLERSRTG